VEDGCKVDEVTPDFTINDELYYIDEHAIVNYVPTWTTRTTGCPTSFHIYRVINGVDTVLSAHELAALTWDPTDASLDLHTDDYTLDGETWNIKIVKRSTHSETVSQDGVYQFNIEFKDKCWDSVLTAPNAIGDPFNFDLWSLQTLTFS